MTINKDKNPRYANKLLKEFEDKGFVPSFSNSRFLSKLRERYSYKVFNAGCKISAGRLSKYGIYEVFGKRMTYYYDIKRKDEFVNFLVEKFYSQNPDASSDLQGSFTRLLHIHGLCWAGCVLHNSAINIRKFKNTIKKKIGNNDDENI